MVVQLNVMLAAGQSCNGFPNRNPDTADGPVIVMMDGGYWAAMENGMRITLHLDNPDGVTPSPYAVVWIDRKTGTWSREGHIAVSLPTWGRLRSEADHTLIYGPDEGLPLCVLEDFSITPSSRNQTGKGGPVQWCGSAEPTARTGRWLVKADDRRHAS
ncbi:DUF3564 family protein [Paraburkholderia azotifigens]|uniref:DUF3564 family protein n=1 Tax=Paraburkholderia azotifigens TaxID=2057004 RepID=A0ABU9R335_9BURK